MKIDGKEKKVWSFARTTYAKKTEISFIPGEAEKSIKAATKGYNDIIIEVYAEGKEITQDNPPKIALAVGSADITETYTFEAGKWERLRIPRSEFVKYGTLTLLFVTQPGVIFRIGDVIGVKR